MPDFEETAEVVDFVDRWVNLPKEEQKRKSMTLLVTTTFAVKSLEKEQTEMKKTIAEMPCQSNGFLGAIAALSRSKKMAAVVTGVIVGVSITIGSIVGLAQAVQAWTH